MRIFGLDIQRQGALRGREQAKALQERVQRLEIAHSELVEHFNVLQGGHAKLRSIVHGDRSGGRPPQPGAARPATTKAEIRAAMGVVQGQRFHHSE